MDEAGKTCEYCHRFIRKDEDGNIYCKAHGTDIPFGCTDHLFDTYKFNELHRQPILKELVGGDEMNTMRELKEELKMTSSGRKFLEEAEPEKQTDNLIEFAKGQCKIFPEDSEMGKYLRKTLKILQVEPCEDVTGHWFVDERPEGDREVICSNCKQPIFRYHKLDFDYRPNHCPNCGAKMREEK